MTNTALIFPAFITDYTQKELEFLVKNELDVNQYIQQASKVLGFELPKFSYDSPEFKNNELYSQLIAYVFSCAIVDVFEKKRMIPSYVAGYSMGIYASLYAVKSISFDDGIRIILKAFQIVSELSRTGFYGMGATIGLSFQDVEDLIQKMKLECEIININNRHSLVVAGKKEDIILLIEKAKNEGAISAMELIVNTPYHSKYLLKYSNLFLDFIQTVRINDAQIPIISCFNQLEYTSSTQIKKELVNNLTEKINWFKTMQKLIDLKVNVMYECGAGKDLTKIARFIEGDYHINSIYKV